MGGGGFRDLDYRSELSNRRVVEDVEQLAAAAGRDQSVETFAAQDAAADHVFAIADGHESVGDRFRIRPSNALPEEKLSKFLEFDGGARTGDPSPEEGEEVAGGFDSLWMNARSAQAGWTRVGDTGRWRQAADPDFFLDLGPVERIEVCRIHTESVEEQLANGLATTVG